MSSSEAGDDDRESSSSEQPAFHPDEPDHNPAHRGNDFSDEDEEREGRFYGPDSSWRHYTENERDVVASLEQAECNDLSIHLYNAHAWKLQHRDAERFKRSQPWHSKQRWIRRDESGNLPFLPLSSWTAWPLRPEDVPRSREQWGIPAAVPNRESEKDTFSKSQSWKPSLHLQDELQAIVLRKAKERFHQRRWEKKDHLSAPELRLISKVEGDGLEHDSKDLEEDEEAAENKLPLETYTPAFTADDEAAGLITKPTVRHIMTTLDNLLAGLHKSRRSLRKEPGAPRGRTSRSASRTRSPSRTPSQLRASAKRKRAASDAIPTEDEDDLHSSNDDNGDQPSPARSRSSGSNSRNRTLGLRDWSEVLGVAALTGWDQIALDRAAQRCATIFGETMSMRIMPETSAAHIHEELVEYESSLIPDFDMLSDDDESEDGDENDDPVNVMALNCCPFVECRRHEVPFPTRWRLREHLRRKVYGHGLTDEEIEALENKGGVGKHEADEDPVKPEPMDEKNLLGLFKDDLQPAVRRDGFLEPINIPIRRPGGERRRRHKSESSTDS